MSGVRVYQHSWPDANMPVLYGNRRAKTAPICVEGIWLPLSARAELREQIRAAIDSNVYATVEYRNGDDIAVIDDEEISDAADAITALIFGADPDGGGAT